MPTSPLILFNSLELKALPFMSSRWQYTAQSPDIILYLMPSLWLYLGVGTFHPSSSLQKCCLVPSLSLLVRVIGATCVIGITAWGTRIGSPSAISGVSCVPGSATVARVRGMEARVKEPLLCLGLWVCGEPLWTKVGGG